MEWLDFGNLVKALIDFMMRIWAWFRDMVWDFIAPYWSAFADACAAVVALMGQGFAALVYLKPYLEFAEAWVPVTFFLQCCAAYAVFWCFLVLYKVIKSWIPTLAGS